MKPRARKKQFEIIQSFLRNRGFARDMAIDLNDAYFRGQKQPIIPLFPGGEKDQILIKSRAEERLADNLSGFYALECGLGVIFEETNQPPITVLKKIAEKKLRKRERRLVSFFAHLTWQISRSFIDLKQFSPENFPSAAMVSRERMKKYFTEISKIARIVHTELAGFEHRPRNLQIKAIHGLLSNVAFARKIGDWIQNNLPERPGSRLMSISEDEPLQKSSFEERIAVNLAGFYALETGMAFFIKENGQTPLRFLENLVAGKLSLPNLLLLSRFANAAWKAGQPFRGLDRITRDIFRPAILLSQDELGKDFVQIRSAAYHLCQALKAALKKTSRTC